MLKPEEIDILRLQPDDWEDFRRIRLRALADSPDAFSSTLEETLELDREEWRRRLRARAQFIAVTALGPVGTAGGVEREARAELISMWVDPRARGSGVGSKLVRSVAEWARGRGCASLWLWVVVGNLAAESLYLRCGFARTGEVQPVGSADPGRREFEMKLPLLTGSAG